ncbi:MAG: helix-turn-helix transcriptional regulator [Oscillospiraceae bacterium]|nr:helix-turn-helix transcriptional regulator [Oscillospiraceae bacterium]
MDVFAEVFYAPDQAGRAFPFTAWFQRGPSPCLYHWHDDVELIYVLQGPIEVRARSSSQLDTGDILLIAGGEPHCLLAESEKSERIAIRFGMQMVKPLQEEHAENLALVERITQVKKCSRDWPEESRIKIRNIMTRLYDEFTGKEEGYQVAIRALTYELMLVILRELPVETAHENIRRSNQENNFKRAIYFLASHYTEDISLKDCADALELNMNYFSRFFRAQAGVNFHEYLTTMRLKKAEYLLITTGISVTEVVEQSGFQNVKTFNRVFKNAHGISPREYRRQHRK